MGLDMYLRAKKRLSKYSGGENGEEKALAIRKEFGIPSSGNLETVEITFEIGYWRKANQIHAWFTDNCAEGVDECQAVYVSREKMVELLDVVQRVLHSTKLIGSKVTNGYSMTEGVKKAILEDGKVMKDHTIAEKLLPCKEGFFFGSTGYDQWYWHDLEETKSILEKALALGEDVEFEYQASW